MISIIYNGASIKIVSSEEASEILSDLKGSYYRRLGLYIISNPRNSGIIEAIDNCDGCAWTEAFISLAHALDWLTDETFDMEKEYKLVERLFKKSKEAVA